MLVVIAVALLVLLITSPPMVYTTYSAKMGQKNAPPTRTYSEDRFIKNCASCHGKDGRAKTFKAKFNHAQDLTNRAWQEAETDEHMFIAISKGRGKMPAFENKIPKSEIAALVTYVRMLKK